MLARRGDLRITKGELSNVGPYLELPLDHFGDQRSFLILPHIVSATLELSGGGVVITFEKPLWLDMPSLPILAGIGGLQNLQRINIDIEAATVLFAATETTADWRTIQVLIDLTKEVDPYVGLDQ
jgi:hypothetical protein